MKQLTQRATELATLFLIETEGITTTLDVKNLLRSHGYSASQSEVSRFMEADMQLGLHNLTRERRPGDAFFTYSLMQPVPPATQAVPLTSAVAPSSAPTWTAYNGNQRFISKEYPTTMTRDQARWKFCVDTGSTWNEARCCLTANFK